METPNKTKVWSGELNKGNSVYIGLSPQMKAYIGQRTKNTRILVVAVTGQPNVYLYIFTF